MENSKICKHNCSQCSANQDVLVHGVNYRNDKKKKNCYILCIYPPGSIPYFHKSIISST